MADKATRQRAINLGSVFCTACQRQGWAHTAGGGETEPRRHQRGGMPGCRNGRCKGPGKDKPGASGGHSQRATGWRAARPRREGCVSAGLPVIVRTVAVLGPPAPPARFGKAFGEGQVCRLWTECISDQGGWRKTGESGRLVPGCLALGSVFGLARRGPEAETPGVQGVRPRAPSRRAG